MQNKNMEIKNELAREIQDMLCKSISDDYTNYILEHKDGWTNISIIDDIIANVLETSAYADEGYYNYDDIKLAIGRVLIQRLGINI